MAGDVGGLLLDARRRAGLTQEELARRAGTTASAISAYEHDRKDPSVGTLRRLVEACGMELRIAAEFLTGAEQAQRSRDASIGTWRGRANAALARAQVLEVRPLSGEEHEALVGGSASTS